ncbi:MAG: hypothetical protein KIT22_03500, partial [Verrucomicrobiae bacterium]|nr:hypothetical protein [Verrucomicrobiae bacterium]
AAWRRELGLKYQIEVDGGINLETARECALAGADVFVAGTALFHQHNLGAAVRKMRRIVQEAHTDSLFETPAPDPALSLL